MTRTKKVSSGASLREICSKCGAKDFVINSGHPQTRFCKCGNVWMPKTREQLVIDELKKTIAGLEKENADLKSQLRAAAESIVAAMPNTPKEVTD